MRKTTLNRCAAIFWPLSVLVIAMAVAGRADVVIGGNSSSSQATISNTMASNVVLSIKPTASTGAASSDGLSTVGMVTFHVSLSWPTSSSVSVQSQTYVLEAFDAGVITSVTAPGFSPSIDGGGISATLSQVGAGNPTGFDVTVDLSNDSAEPQDENSHFVVLCGTALLNDGSQVVDLAPNFITYAGQGNPGGPSPFTQTSPNTGGPPPATTLDAVAPPTAPPTQLYPSIAKQLQLKMC